MIRKICVAAALLVALVGISFAPQAEAQGDTQCQIVFDPPPVTTAVPVTGGETDDATAESADATAAHSCADASAYPGPFTNMPRTPSSPYAAPFGLTTADPVAPVETTAPPSGSGLAHSGSEIFVLAYLGTGLLAFGAVALGVRRGSVPK